MRENTGFVLYQAIFNVCKLIFIQVIFALSSEYTAIHIRIDPNQPSDTRGRIIARRWAKQQYLYSDNRRLQKVF